MKLVLTLKYRTPSLNVTKRQHWSAQYREKQKAYLALALALQGIVSDRLTRIISQEELRIASTAYATLGSYLATNRGGSGSKPNKSGSGRSKRKKQS